MSSNMLNKVGFPRYSEAFNKVPTTRKARAALLTVFAFLAFLYLFKPYPPTGVARYERPDSSVTLHQGEGGPSVVKVTMLYGSANPLYERAVRSHKLHNEQHGYPMHVLRNEITGGYWNKPAYLLSLVIQEMTKPPGERAQWIMWVDADLILVNPAIPLEVFLPPWDFQQIHFIGNRDQNGLNTGTFFLHVHEWSVRMLVKAMALPMFKPDMDLGTSMDQMAMALIFKEKEFAAGVMYQPRVWFNTYEFKHGYEGKKGNLLVHFPGLEEERWRHMNDWLAITESNPHTWEVPLEETDYPEHIAKFYKDLREAKKVIAFAETKVAESEVIDKEIAFKAIDALREASAVDSDRSELLNDAMTQLKQLVAYPEGGT